MSADVLRRAAAKLRDPLLCNFDRELALALADWLESEAALLGFLGDNARQQGIAVARAVLREDGESQ